MMHARFLETGEEQKWFDFFDERSSRHFTQEPDYRPESHIVVAEDDRFLGCMHLIIEEPELVLLFNPKVQVADALKLIICEGIKTAKSLHVHVIGCLIHGSNKQFNIIEKMLPDLGFVFGMKKALYQLKPASITDSGVSASLTFVSLEHVAEARFIEIFEEVYEPDMFDEPDMSKSSAAKCFADLKKRAVETKRFYPEDWEIAYIATKPVGITMPQLHDEMAQFGSNFLVGVVTGERRKGIGKALQRRAVETLIRRGAESIVGSTDIRNKPMLRIFESLGYELIEHQYFYRYHTMS